MTIDAKAKSLNNQMFADAVAIGEREARRVVDLLADSRNKIVPSSTLPQVCGSIRENILEGDLGSDVLSAHFRYRNPVGVAKYLVLDGKKDEAFAVLKEDFGDYALEILMRSDRVHFLSRSALLDNVTRIGVRRLRSFTRSGEDVDRDAVDDLLHVMCLLIQDYLKVDDGGFAGVYFSGDEAVDAILGVSDALKSISLSPGNAASGWSDLRKIMARYMDAELRNLSDEKPANEKGLYAYRFESNGPSGSRHVREQVDASYLAVVDADGNEYRIMLSKGGRVSISVPEGRLGIQPIVSNTIELNTQLPS